MISQLLLMCGLLAQIPTAEIPLTQTTGICCSSETTSSRYEGRQSPIVLPSKKRRVPGTLEPSFPDDSLDFGYEGDTKPDYNAPTYGQVVRHGIGGVQKVA